VAIIKNQSVVRILTFNSHLLLIVILLSVKSPSAKLAH
jgi:hypothetical protein